MTKEKLCRAFDKLQNEYGSKSLHAVYGGGCEDNPEFCFIFINPTARNISAHKSWKGIRRQWLGIKSVWAFFAEVGLFDKKLNEKIQSMRPEQWTEEFCEEVYKEVEKKKIYITDLGKCSQDDARSLPDSVYTKYRDLLFEEIKMIRPQKIVLFGNQVSSVVLGEKISVSQCRRQCKKLVLDGVEFDCYPVFYPVGNGRFNAPKAIEDVRFLKNKR